MEEGVIPGRIEGETAKAYKAFVDYCEMGAARSLPELQAQYQQRMDSESAEGKPPTRLLRTLFRWSATHGWQERVADYERRAAERRTLERIQKQIEIEQSVLEDAERMRAVWAHRFAGYEDLPKGVSTYDLRQMFSARADIDDLERRSAGLPHRATEVKHGGEGKDGEIVIRVVFDGIDSQTTEAT